MNDQLVTKASRINKCWPMAMLGLLIVVQLFVPIVSAAATEKSEDGNFVLVCTLQGLQQILLSDDDSIDLSTDQSHQGPVDCPLCSLTNLYMSALATLSPDTPKDPSQQGYPILENESVFPDRPIYATPARAPPTA